MSEKVYTNFNIRESDHTESLNPQTDDQVTLFNNYGTLSVKKHDGTVVNLESGGGASGYSGYSGYSGMTGASGISGYSGYSGMSGTGPAGTSGYSGYSGISGANGSNGTSGYSGYSGYSGAGTSGYSGYSGISGTNGSDGTSGYSGYSGYSGAGTSGYSGYSGYSGAGTSGYSGYSGINATGEEKSFQIEFVTSTPYYLTTYAPYAYTVDTINWNVDIGTANISLSGGSAGTTAIGALTSITGGTSTVQHTATTNKTISAGHKLKLMVNSITSGASVLYGTIKTTRT